MHNRLWILAVIVLLGFGLRMAYCWNLPLSGDECISFLQAAGRAADPKYQIPLEQTPVE